MTAQELGATDQADGLLRTLGRAYSALVDYFLPDSMRGDRGLNNRARMFLLSHFLGPCLGGSAPLALYIADPTPGAAIAVMAVGILSFWVFPFLMKWGIAYDRLVLLSIAVDWFVIYWACFHYGGVRSPTLVWMLIIPILAVFYIGADDRPKGKLVALGAVSSIIFMVAYAVIGPAPNDIPPAAVSVLGATSTIAVMCYVAMMAIYYSRIHDAGAVLEKEVKRRQEMAVELRRAVVAADRASSAKSEFLARMSHELRTPLNAIIGYGQLLRDDAVDAQDKVMIRDVDRILDAGHYLVRLIGMILDLSKIEAGRMKFDVRRHSLPRLLEAAVAQRAEAIAAGGNRAELEIAPDLDEVMVDANRLREVVDSIVENAARHTRDGAVCITACKTHGGDTAMFSIAVSDTGIGIAPDVLGTVFETFSIPREAAEGRYGGTGLNLAVTSKLCRAMGGSITVESVLGEGTTFTITLPLGG